MDGALADVDFQSGKRQKSLFLFDFKRNFGPIHGQRCINFISKEKDEATQEKQSAPALLPR